MKLAHSHSFEDWFQVEKWMLFYHLFQKLLWFSFSKELYHKAERWLKIVFLSFWRWLHLIIFSFSTLFRMNAGFIFKQQFDSQTSKILTIFIAEHHWLVTHPTVECVVIKSVVMPKTVGPFQMNACTRSRFLTIKIRPRSNNFSSVFSHHFGLAMIEKL